MFQIIGIVVLFAMVFGSFIISGGKLGVILHALPHELMAIFGAAIAAFLISNSMPDHEGDRRRPGQGVRRARSGRPRDYTRPALACCSC